MTNKPEAERIKKYLDDKIVEGLLRQMKEYIKALAEAGAQPEYIQKVMPDMGRICARMAEHFAPEEKKWSLVNDIADYQCDDELKKSAIEGVAEGILDKVDAEFGREVEELSEACWKSKKNQGPPVA